MSTERERDLIKHHLERIVGYMQRNEAPGMDKFSEITPHIYISGWQNACDIQLLREHGIKGVLSLCTDEKPQSVLRGYEKRHIKHASAPVTPDPPDNIIPHMQNLIGFIHMHVKEEEKVLVHCRDGISVSPAVVSMYFLSRYYLTNFLSNESVTRNLVKPEAMYAPAIIKFVKQFRPCIMIHPGYTYQILLGEMLLKRQFSANYLQHKKNLAAQKKAERKRKSDKRADLDELDEAPAKPAKPKRTGTRARKTKRVRTPEPDPEEELIESDEMENYIAAAIDNTSEFDELTDIKNLKRHVQESVSDGDGSDGSDGSDLDDNSESAESVHIPEPDEDLEDLDFYDDLDEDLDSLDL